ncbi:hypothetical protein EJ08DRAFT_736726 [Tothia fuscella]|uniref:Uncharacterized protein n=1 Tax=Tothia fuscella TaxID=1048955 RepID=A0A9P4NKR3_9PEZI|nr:hypothetical protein EJ08DRAFT_736726 [Tothia fuscella]
MKSFEISTALTILAAFPISTNALFACSIDNAVPFKSLLPSSYTSGGGSSGGSSGGGGGYIPTPNPAGCSFYIAAGGSCTPAKYRTKRTYNKLPCPDDWQCVSAGGTPGCYDTKTNNFIDDQGTCGNLFSDETIPNCVEQIMAEASSSVSAPGTKATATGKVAMDATGATGSATAAKSTGTASAVMTSGGMSISDDGARVASWSLAGWEQSEDKEGTQGVYETDGLAHDAAWRERSRVPK